MLKLRLIYVFVVSEVVLQSSFTFMFRNPTIVKKNKNTGIQSCWLRSYGHASLKYGMGHYKESMKSKTYMYTNVLYRHCSKTLYI